MTETVFVAAIFCEQSGPLITVHRTEAAASEAVVRYCRENWDIGFGDGQPPDDRAELIDRYFKAREFDTYAIEECRVEEEPTTAQGPLFGDRLGEFRVAVTDERSRDEVRAFAIHAEVCLSGQISGNGWVPGVIVPGGADRDDIDEVIAYGINEGRVTASTIPADPDEDGSVPVHWRVEAEGIAALRQHGIID
jgi:hypothetical protein